MKDFNEWLDDRLNESVGEHYDPNGNSARAVVCRRKKGLINSIWYECKSVVSDIKFMFTYEWDGFNTKIGWFIQLFLLPVMIWFLPFTRTYGRYKSAIKDYKSEYSEAKSRFEREKNKK